MPTDHLPYVPSAEVLPGIELMRLPEGYTPLSAIVLVKCLDDDGDVAWLTRSASDLGGIESLGALHAAVAVLTEDIKASYRDCEPDEE
jgi:hypothetical protein